MINYDEMWDDGEVGKIGLLLAASCAVIAYMCVEGARGIYSSHRPHAQKIRRKTVAKQAAHGSPVRSPVDSLPDTMAAPMATPEKLILLKEMGDGLLCSLYLTLSRLHESSLNRPTEQIYSTFVRDPQYAPLRNRIGHAFPKAADLRGVPGQDVFEKSAGMVIRFFVRFKGLVHDLVDFTETSLPLLLSLPASLSSLSLHTNRSTALLYLDLLCTYLRVMLLFATCHEAKAMYSLNAAAEKIYKEKSLDESNLGSPPGSPPPTSPAAARRQTITAAGLASLIPASDISTPEDLTYLPRAAQLFKSTFDDLHGFLLATMAPLRKPLSTLLAEMGPSVALAKALQTNSTHPRWLHLLDPSFMEGARLGQPDCPKVPADASSDSPVAAEAVHGGANPLPAYLELCDYEKYADTAILLAVACPAVLFDPACRLVVSSVAKEVLVIRLFRDVCVNVHVELEAVIARLCPKDMTGDEKRRMGKPKGLKLRGEAKEWARHALEHAPAAQRAVRCLLAARIGGLNALLALSPGLLGPRFPQVLCIAALAKSAAMCYFRHANNEALKMRRDCRHLFDHAAYTADGFSATELLSALLDLTATCSRLKDVVTAYYATFLATTDAEALSKLCTKMTKGSLLPAFMPILQSFPGTLHVALSSSYSSSSSSSAVKPTPSNPNPNPNPFGATSASRTKSTIPLDGRPQLGAVLSREAIIFGRRSSVQVSRDLAAEQEQQQQEVGGLSPALDLFSMRLSWERCLLALSAAKMESYLAFPLVAELLRKMPRVCERTRYVGDFPCLVTQHAEPYELCWFQAPVQKAFMAALSDTRSVDAPSQALSYLLVPLMIRRNVHVDAPAEDKLVGRDSVRFLDDLLGALGDHVVAGVRALWHETQRLEVRQMPLEAAR